MKGGVLAEAALTKYQRLDDFSDRYLFPHSSRGWKSEVRAQNDWVLTRAFSSLFIESWFLPVSSYSTQKEQALFCLFLSGN